MDALVILVGQLTGRLLWGTPDIAQVRAVGAAGRNVYPEGAPHQNLR